MDISLLSICSTMLIFDLKNAGFQNSYREPCWNGTMKRDGTPISVLKNSKKIVKILEFWRYSFIIDYETVHEI